MKIGKIGEINKHRGNWGIRAKSTPRPITHQPARQPARQLASKPPQIAIQPASQPGRVSARMATKSGFGQASWQYYFCYKIWSNSVKLEVLDENCKNEQRHAKEKLKAFPKYSRYFQNRHFTKKCFQNRTATRKRKVPIHILNSSPRPR